MNNNNNNKIRQEAKQILDKFAKALEKVETKEENFYVDRDEFEREEGSGNGCEKGFKKKILNNAPESDDDFIIAEKGSWK